MTLAYWVLCGCSGFGMARGIRYDDGVLFGASMVSLIITMFLIGRKSK